MTTENKECPGCAGDPAWREAVIAQCRSLIEDVGWSVMLVGGNPHSLIEREFAYTVGLWESYGHPEVLVLGLLPDVLHNVCNIIGRQVNDGGTFEPGVPYGDILDGADAHFVQIDRNHYDRLNLANAIYEGTDYPALQMIWPDWNGNFPWEDRCNVLTKAVQPLLGPLPNLEGEPR